MEEKPDPLGELKERKPKYWMPVAALAVFFLIVFSFAFAGSRAIESAKARLKTAVSEKFEELAENVKFSFEIFEKGLGRRAGGKPKDVKPETDTLPILDFEKKTHNTKLQSNDSSDGSFKRKHENGNAVMALEIKSLRPSEGSSGYYVTGSLDLGVMFNPVKSTGLRFSVRSNRIRRFTFFMWAWQDNKWRYFAVHDLKAAREWEKIEIPFSDFKSSSNEQIDSIRWVGWNVGSLNNRPNVKGELLIDDFGFIRKK